MRLATPDFAYADPIREPLSLNALFATGEEGSDSFDILDPTTDIELAVERAEARKMIEAFLGTLGDRDRAIVEGIYFDGVSQTQAAQNLRISGAAISKRLAQIIARGKVALAPLRDSSFMQ